MYCISCLLSIIGCRQEIKNNSTDGIVNVDDSTKIIKIGEINENQIIKFSDIYNTINFVRLETKDECLIGRIDKIVATRDKFVILDTSSAKMVFVFSNNGTFLNKIGSNGRGPLDYDEPNDIAYDEQRDELLVLCHNRQTILKFKLDGTFIEKIFIEWWVNSMHIVENNYLLYLNNRIQPNGKKHPYNIIIINKDGKDLKHLLPIDEETSDLYPPKSTFSDFNTEIIFSTYYFNKVYKLEDNDIKIKYLLDFGKWMVPESAYKNINDKELDKIISDNDYAFNIASFETSTHIICQFLYKRFVFNCFYSKETQITKTSAVYFNDLNSFLTGHSHFFVKGDSLIGYIEPVFISSYKDLMSSINEVESKNGDVGHALMNYYSSLLPDSKIKDNFLNLVQSTKISLTKKEIDFINGINEMDNPILIIVKLKNF